MWHTLFDYSYSFINFYILQINCDDNSDSSG